MNKTHVLQVRITEEQLAAVTEIAARSDVPRSQVIRKAITEYIDWSVTFDSKTTDEDARRIAACRLNCREEDIELLRHNIVMCRHRSQEATNGR